MLCKALVSFRHKYIVIFVRKDFLLVSIAFSVLFLSIILILYKRVSQSDKCFTNELRYRAALPCISLWKICLWFTDKLGTHILYVKHIFLQLYNMNTEQRANFSLLLPWVSIITYNWLNNVDLYVRWLCKNFHKTITSQHLLHFDFMCVFLFFFWSTKSNRARTLQCTFDDVVPLMVITLKFSVVTIISTPFKIKQIKWKIAVKIVNFF